MVAGRHEQTEHLSCQTLSWPECNQALKHRGALTVWCDPDRRWAAQPTGKRGRQPVRRGVGDHKTVWQTVFPTNAIQTCLTVTVLFGNALRQTTGVIKRRRHLIGLDWAVPDVSTRTRRQKRLAVHFAFCGSRGSLFLLIDRTGIKVAGEGEWDARRQGGTKRRVRRRLHIGIDAKILDIGAAEFSPCEAGKAPMLP